MCDRLQRRAARTAPASGSAGPVALGHRRLTIIDLSDAGAQPMVDARARAAPSSSTAASTTTRSCAPSCERHGYRFFSTSDTEVIAQGLPPLGRGLRRALPRHVRLRVVERGHRPAWSWPATGWASSRCTWPRPRTGCASPPRCRRCWPAAASTPRIDPVALHHYMTFHAVVPAPRTILSGVRKLPPATVRVDRAGRHASRDREYWRPVHDRRPDQADWTRRTGRSAVARARCGPPSSGGWSPTSRSACCSPAASTPASSSALLAEAGQHGLPTFSIGFEAVGERAGDEFVYSDVIAETLRAPTTTGSMVPSADVLRRRWTARSAR